MAGYRRFVAYVYEYQKGKKAGNCGFIKVEQREERCTLEVHLQCPGLTPNTECRVYGFIRRAGLIEGILLGSCRTQESRVEHTIQTDSQNMGSSGIGLKELGGMILTTENGAFFGTEWDDEAIRPENFRELVEERRDVVLPAADSDREKIIPVSETDTEQSVKHQAENNEEKKIPENTGDHEERGQGALEMKEKQPAADREQSSVDEGVSEEKNWESQEGKTDDFKDASLKELNGAEDENEERPELETSETQTLERQTGKENSIPGGGFYMQMPGNTLRPPQPGLGNNPLRPGMNQRPLQPAPGNNPTQLGTDQRPPRSAPGQSPSRPGMNRHPSQPAPGQNSSRSQSGNQGKGQFWIGEPCELFDDGEIAGCWKIQPKDLAHFDRRDWTLRNNRFLLYGYYNFGHILLGQKADGTYILGVPGGYDQQERFMANMFGFPCFKESRSIRLKRGKGGYWYRSINPPNFH